MVAGAYCTRLSGCLLWIPDDWHLNREQRLTALDAPVKGQQATQLSSVEDPEH